MPCFPETAESALIVVASSKAAVPHQKLSGAVQHRGPKTLTVLTDEKISESATVRIQTRDFVSFGDVVSCVPQIDAKWCVSVAVNRSLLII